MKQPLVFLTLVASILSGWTVRADEGDLKLQAQVKPTETARLALDAGLGSFAEDGMATLHASLVAEDQIWRLVVDPRLRLRTLDRAPYESTVRQEDWDEPADYAHVLRELSFRRTLAHETDLRLTLGEQSELSIGHGTLVRQYTNALDPDHLHAGAHFVVDDPWFGLQAMVDNITGPRLVATRLSVHPLDERITVGGTAAFDLYAPHEIRENPDGSRSIDGTQNLEAYFSTLGMAGGDAEVVLRKGSVSFVPYLDTNALLGLGAGLHTGAELRIEPGATSVQLRGEYRLSSDRYWPSYADTLYDITRLQARLAAPNSNPLPQRAEVEAGGFGGHGFLAEASLKLRRWRMQAAFSRRPGAEGNLLVTRLDATITPRLLVVARYLHRGVGQVPSDSGIIVTTGLRWMLSSAFYAAFDYAHTPRLAESGIYQPIQVATVGLGATIGF